MSLKNKLSDEDVKNEEDIENKLIKKLQIKIN